MSLPAAILRIRRPLPVCLFLLCGLLPGRGSATHFAAADLYLNYAGLGPADQTYQVTLVVYKACEPNNAPLDTVSETLIAGSGCFPQWTVTVPAVGGPDTMGYLCPSLPGAQNCWSDSSAWPAFVRMIYSTTVTFPSACSDVTVSWSGCDRNYGIVNLQTQPPGVQCLYLEARMNTVARWNNNTPRFTVDPIPYVCQNQPSFYYNGAMDPDNDSLDVVAAWPMHQAGIQVPFASSYSVANPIGSPAGYNVDPVTGGATFTGPTQGKFVLAFTAKDYDKATGTELGCVTRDVQVSVLNCNATPPSLSPMPNNLTGAVWIATPPQGGHISGGVGQPFSFTVSASSSTTGNNLYLQANNQSTAPSSNLLVNAQGTANPVATFSWTPGIQDLGSHTVLFTVIDSTCIMNAPIMLKNYLPVFIEVDSFVNLSVAGHQGVPFGIYPNPARTGFWVLSREGSSAGELLVMDARGVVVKTQRLKASATATWIDIGAQPAGIYGVMLINGANRQTRRLIVR